MTSRHFCSKWLALRDFGRRALMLKEGRLALTVERTRVVAIEWHEESEAPAPASDDSQSAA